MPESSSALLIERLRVVFADTYALYLKTQNYHWNVVGPHFASLHGLFEGQYEELADALDAITERVRMMGAFAPGTFEEIQSLTSIKSGQAGQTATQMVGDLLGGHDELIRRISDALVVAGETGDEVTTSILSDRLGNHEKAAWMLRSTLA